MCWLIFHAPAPSAPQDAFDVMFRQNLLGTQRHVQLLPPHQLNTEPPAFQSFTPDTTVLHLMGDIAPIRRTIFR